MTDPSVAIVVVNYNGADFLEEFATSLSATTYPNQRLLLIDNASTDGSRDRLRTLFPAAEVLLNDRNLGLAPALNQALDRCLDDTTRYVMFLNPDTTHDPAFIDRLVVAADDRTIVVPKVLSYFDHSRINTHAGGFDWTRGVFVRTFDGAPDGPTTSARHEVETASFCCMLIPVGAFSDAGRLDERLAMYYEDTDFVARATTPATVPSSSLAPLSITARVAPAAARNRPSSTTTPHATGPISSTSTSPPPATPPSPLTSSLPAPPTSPDTGSTRTGPSSAPSSAPSATSTPAAWA
jgi:glycosyltransferase involved in cell wall biosynthesis